NEKYYEELEGGILESMGRMFRHAVKLYIYPMRQDAYDRYLASGHPAAHASGTSHAFASTVMITARNLQVSDRLRNLYAHLLENHNLDCIIGSNPDYLNIFSRDVLQRIKSGDDTWEKMVPTKVAEIIKQRKLLGYGAKPQAAAV
ncbi:MAG TPA: TonB-dependent receptor, partial [Lacunisphaera sp.]|nr:TonB-dependent receptor [Lacunisphaera sp.]